MGLGGGGGGVGGVINIPLKLLHYSWLAFVYLSDLMIVTDAISCSSR